jgi:hypothetical protein
METAGEGGAWGIAFLASYMVDRKENGSLDDFLKNRVFTGKKGEKVLPDLRSSWTCTIKGCLWIVFDDRRFLKHYFDT